VMSRFTWLCGSDITGFDFVLLALKNVSLCSMFSEDVFLDLLCSSVREPKSFFEKVGAGAIFQKRHTAPQHCLKTRNLFYGWALSLGSEETNFKIDFLL